MDEIAATYTMLYWACGLLLIFYTPFNLKTTAKLRMRQNSFLSQTLHYEFSERGIRVSYLGEDEQQTMVSWNEFYRIIETKTQILIYTSRINASVIPKTQISDLSALKEILRNNLEPHRLTLRK